MRAREKHSNFFVTRVVPLRVCSARRLSWVGDRALLLAALPTRDKRRALQTRSGAIRVTKKFESFSLPRIAPTLFLLCLPVPNIFQLTEIINAINFFLLKLFFCILFLVLTPRFINFRLIITFKNIDYKKILSQKRKIKRKIIFTRPDFM